MAKIDEEEKAILKEISKNVQGIGRRIGSPKNNTDDLTDLRDALNLSAEALQHIRDAINFHTS